MSQFEDRTFEVDPDTLYPLVESVRLDATQLNAVGDIPLPDTRFCRALQSALSRYDDASAALFTEAESIAESVELMISDAVAADNVTAAGFERTLA